MAVSVAGRDATSVVLNRAATRHTTTLPSLLRFPY